MKIGLVLEGGGLRGVFSAGVLDALLDFGKEFDYVVAVSAGSSLACSFLCGQVGRGYKTAVSYLDDKECIGLHSFVHTGDFFGAEFIYHKIPEQLYPIDNEAFLRAPKEFHAVITNCVTGMAEYPEIHDMLNDTEYIRASSSLPLISRMVALDGNEYLDGGVADPIPMMRAFEDGCDKVVVVLTQHREFRKRAETTLPLIRKRYKDYPNLIADMERRHLIYNGQRRDVFAAERIGTAFVLEPPRPLGIGRADKNRERLLSGYATGYEVVRERLEDLNQFLSK